MAVRPVLEIGHPVLASRAQEIDPASIGTDQVQGWVDDLIDTMRERNGAGIAANQIGIAHRLFVVEVGENPRYPYKPAFPLTVMINPRISFLSAKRFRNYEGCLSIPNFRGEVERCPEIRVEGLDRHGQALDFEVRGVSAGTFQHEQDHLDGILYTDKLVEAHSLCTLAEFTERHEQHFAEQVKKLVAQYGS